MAHDLVILGLKGSPFVRKVQVLLAEKNVDYDMEMASPFGEAEEFAKINPAKRIPVLRDRSVGTEGADGTLPDSSAICLYIERKHPEPALYPAGDFDYGRALWYEEYADTVLAGFVGMGIFRPMILVRMFNQEPDPERARKTLAEDLPPVFDYLESEIAGREFLLGDTLSIADISVASQFVNFELAGARLDAARWPALAGYVERLHVRPSFADCIEAERKILPASDVEL